jgi:predicted  nucleic acid-binding Zn-ribbon protein
MGAMLEALKRLQTVETQLAEFRRQREEKQRRVVSHQRNVARIEEQIRQHERSVREKQMRIDALQLEIASADDNINRHRQGLNKAKTNKEYAAILTAMNTEKADNTKLENEALQFMEELQQLKSKTGELEAEHSKIGADVGRAEEAISAFEAQSKSRLDELTAKRNEYAEGIPPTALELFTRVAEHHDGIAMVPVTKSHPKRDEFICSGCNMKVTLDMVASLQTKDEIQACRVCGRIMYMDSPFARSKA